MVNRSDLYKEVAVKSGFASTNVNEVFSVLNDVLIEHLRNMEEVRLFDGVTFVPVHVEEKTRFMAMRNEEITTPEHNLVKVKFTKTFVDKVNK